MTNLVGLGIVRDAVDRDVDGFSVFERYVDCTACHLNRILKHNHQISANVGRNDREISKGVERGKELSATESCPTKS